MYTTCVLKDRYDYGPNVYSQDVPILRQCQGNNEVLVLGDDESKHLAMDSSAYTLIEFAQHYVDIEGTRLWSEAPEATGENHKNLEQKARHQAKRRRAKEKKWREESKRIEAMIAALGEGGALHSSFFRKSCSIRASGGI